MLTRMSVYTSCGVCGVAGNLPKERAPPPSKDPKHSENTLGRPCVSASWLGMDANWLLPSPMRPSASWSWIVPDSRSCPEDDVEGAVRVRGDVPTEVHLVPDEVAAHAAALRVRSRVGAPVGGGASARANSIPARRLALLLLALQPLAGRVEPGTARVRPALGARGARHVGEGAAGVDDHLEGSRRRIAERDVRVVVSVLLDRSVQRERGRAVGLARGLEDAATAMRIMLAEVFERGRGARALAASHGEHGRGAAERRFRQSAATPNVVVVGMRRGASSPVRAASPDAPPRAIARRIAHRTAKRRRAPIFPTLNRRRPPLGAPEPIVKSPMKSPRGRHQQADQTVLQALRALGKAEVRGKFCPTAPRPANDGSDDAERPPSWICFSPRPSATPPSCKPARATTRARARASSRSSTSTTARSSCAIPRSRSCRRLSSPRLRSRTRATSRPPRSTRAPRAGEYPIERERKVAVVPRRPSGRETPEKSGGGVPKPSDRRRSICPPAND